MEYLMKDLIPEWIETYEGFQQMPLELSATIDLLLETKDMTPDIAETREFLADRYNTLQDEIDKWKAVAATGSKILVINDLAA